MPEMHVQKDIDFCQTVTAEKQSDSAFLFHFC